MTRLKLWTVALCCLTLSGSPITGMAAPKQQQAQANAIRMNYSLTANQTSTLIELPPNLPAHVMVTMMTPSPTFTWVDLVSFVIPGNNQLFANGFDLMGPTVPSNPPTAPYRVVGTGSFANPTHLLTLGSFCAELIAVGTSAIAVHNKDLDDQFQTCTQITGTITVIY